MLQEVKGLEELEDSESRKELTIITFIRIKLFYAKIDFMFQQVVYVINEVYTTTFLCSK